MKNKSFKILVPTDFSQQSDLALHQAIHFAEIAKAEVELLYVLHEKKGILASIFNKTQEETFDKAIEAKLLEQANHFKAKHKLTITIKLLHSTSVHGAIVDYSQKFGASLIIMGKGCIHENDIELPTIGSNTAKVVRHSKIPVITIGNSGHSKGIRNILLPLDLTKETRQKVSWAIKIAKIFNSKITVVSGLWDSNKEFVVTKLNSQMKQVVKFIKEQGIDCTSAIIESKSDKSLTPIIQRYIDKNDDIDLVIIMTQQENDVTEFFMGSSATSFIREIKLPVLSVIPRDLDTIIVGF